MKKIFIKQNGFGTLFVFFIIAMIVFGAGGGYILSKKYPRQKQQPSQNINTPQKAAEPLNNLEIKHVNVQKEVELQAQGTSTVKGVTVGGGGTLKGNISIEADVQTTESCAEQGCFETKFKTCEKATRILKAMEGLVYQYEIVGLENKLCKVKSKFTENPNPSWVGKEMVCLVDNSKALEVATQNLNIEKDCHGPLADLMTGR